MPHCVIEYAKDLEDKVEPMLLINAVHNGAVASGLFDEDHIKTRARAYSSYKTGTGDNAFIHVTVSILSGRNIDQKKNLSNSILTWLERLSVSAVTMTVQICDIETEVYTKMVL